MDDYGQFRGYRESAVATLDHDESRGQRRHPRHRAPDVDQDGGAPTILRSRATGAPLAAWQRSGRPDIPARPLQLAYGDPAAGQDQYGGALRARAPGGHPLSALAPVRAERVHAPAVESDCRPESDFRRCFTPSVLDTQQYIDTDPHGIPAISDDEGIPWGLVEWLIILGYVLCIDWGFLLAAYYWR